MTSDQISHKLNTNPVVIRRVLSRLQQAELIDSQKGPSGGSKLARPAKEIRLGEVYSALEPSALFNASAAQDARLNNTLQKIFTGAQAALESELNGSNIGQLARKLSKSKK